MILRFVVSNVCESGWKQSWRSIRKRIARTCGTRCCCWKNRPPNGCDEDCSVPEGLIFTDKEAAFLKELVRNDVAFMVVGLSAAALQGAPAVTQGIDLWFKDLGDPGILRALHRVGGSYVPPMGLNPPTFAGRSVALFDIVLRMDGLASFDDEAKNALSIPVGGVEVRVLPLDRILASKRAANRPKDKVVLSLLEDTLAALPSRRKKRARRTLRR